MGLKNKKAANAKTKSRVLEVAPVTQPSPTHEEIQRRAYEIHLSQGATDGRDLDDWLQAERDLRLLKRIA
ncbi:MAG TPA: DUF2934 domain-containing protein [Blastocatellia bacterium]|jgi:hypothetical protein|nr:DUF2934 domain-containing protein [Blastocatellia bacterium]